MKNYFQWIFPRNFYKIYQWIWLKNGCKKIINLLTFIYMDILMKKIKIYRGPEEMIYEKGDFVN